jgi:hypothetical protein
MFQEHPEPHLAPAALPVKRNADGSPQNASENRVGDRELDGYALVGSLRQSLDPVSDRFLIGVALHAEQAPEVWIVCKGGRVGFGIVDPHRAHGDSVVRNSIALSDRRRTPPTRHLIRSDATCVRDTFPAASRAVTETR